MPRARMVGLTCAALLTGCQTFGPLSDPCSYDKDDPALAREIERLAAGSEPPNVLVLSGGGRNGAYGAGFLRGLAARGDIDLEFDVVTGVSTGALQGTYAFLGRRHASDSDYDRLSALYTNVSNRDIYRLRLLPFKSSLYHTRPLARLLDRQVSDSDITAVGQVTGRRFYVGTLDLAQGRIKVHDMGCIARTHPPDYYRKLLLASASIPVAFPAIEINDSLQVDGGVRDQALLERFMIPPSSNAALTVIVNMPLTLREQPAKRTLISTGVRTVYVMMNEGLRNDIERIREFAPAATRIKHIPFDFLEEWSPITFDREIMRRLEALGYEHATRNPIPWD